MPLVNKLVKQFKYYPRVLQKEDLYQEGVLGLIKALNHYQDLGYDFIAYATPTIKIGNKRNNKKKPFSFNPTKKS
ncbi:hypothetical protein PAWBP_5980 [Paulownia witches'-broom phytoplasma]|nr:hypothetical protein PAWBP_5980 [Paulownia witches'-broom phytoplasma]